MTGSRNIVVNAKIYRSNVWVGKLLPNSTTVWQLCLCDFFDESILSLRNLWKNVEMTVL